MHRAASPIDTIAAAGTAAATGSADVVAPNAGLKTENMPPVPAELAARVAPYTGFAPTTVVDWHPEKLELIVARRADNLMQLHRVASPGAEPRQITSFAEPVEFGTYLTSESEALVFARDIGGNEQHQLYRLDDHDAVPVLLTDPMRKHEPCGFTHARDRLLVRSTEVDATGRREEPCIELSLLVPSEPAKSRKIATLPGTGWECCCFSFDDERLALIEHRSVSETHVWVMDIAGGTRRRVLPAGTDAPAQPIASIDLNFSRDGDAIFLATDRDSEFCQLAYLNLTTGALDHFGEVGDWDVEGVALSPDGRTLAVISNEAGFGVLRLYDTETRRALVSPALPAGVLSRPVWHRNSRHVAVTLSSAQSAGDAYVVDARDSSVTRWTETRMSRIDAKSFRSAVPISWKSFDGRTICGFMLRPPSRFAGPRPVIVAIHGGPESQSRPGFNAYWNYFADELGIAVILPNVRGSTGYGKTFVKLDNGVLREDSVKDIGALFDWIRAQPDLDASRVAIHGRSYGGYMVLGVATNYPDRFVAAIDIVGIADFVSFLESTESYRRDLRRVEYGDERDPAMREFLTRISPLSNVHKIKAPLFVVAGRNDPRVRYTEAEQIVAAVRRNGVPVWYLLAENEGHVFARKENVDYVFFATILFLQERLLNH
jgi:dipeptidyl aminopeptidase/acylaminoacyl peptidase